MLAPHGRCLVSPLADVIMLNGYHGWYVKTGDLVGAEHALRAELKAGLGEGKLIITSEYGPHPRRPALDGPDSVDRGKHIDHLAMDPSRRRSVEAVVGEHGWSFADFANKSGMMRSDGNRKGPSPETGARRRPPPCCPDGGPPGADGGSA